MLLGPLAAAEEGAPAGEPVASATAGDKTLSGMSILGNQEAPKALVIVPWKSSRIGDSLGLSDSLDDARQPVERRSSCGSSPTTRSGPSDGARRRGCVVNRQSGTVTR